MAESDSALDGLLEGIGKGGARETVLAPPVHDPALDRTLDVLTPRTPREARLMKNLAVSEPAEGMGDPSSLPMLGADFAGAALAGRGLTAAARAVGLPAVGRFLTGASQGLAKLPSLAASGALQGALAAKVNSLFGQETPSGTAAVAGAGVNALTGGIGRALFGNNISQEAAQRAQAIRASGIPLATGNVPGASFAARLAGKLTGATRPDAEEFTRHIMRSVGSDDELLTGETLARAKQRLQGTPGNPAAGTAATPGEFDRIAASAQPITWQSAPGLRRELTDIVADANNNYGLQQNNPDEMRRVFGHIQNVVDGLNAGGISGGQLQALTNMNSDLSRLASGGTAGNYLGTRIKRALYNAAGEADPATASALSLARNQYRNISMLEPRVEQLTDANGVVDPAKVSARIRSTYGNFQQASDAAVSSGQPTDLGTLGEAGQRFGAQPVARPSLPAAVGLGSGLGAFGAEELAMGFPLLEGLAHHPLVGLGASAGMLGVLGSSLPVGAAQNSNLLTNFLLSRASRGAPALLGGANPLVGLGVASQGASAPQVPTRNGLPETNWDNWLRGQSFLESPQGEPSKSSSAKGYFQFIDSTAKKAREAGLPDPRAGGYEDQANATRAYIQRFYPKAASAISQGDFPTAAATLAGEWPSLPGGSQQQAPSQYTQWNKILQAGESPLTGLQ